MIDAIRQRAQEILKTNLGPQIARRQPTRVDLSADTWDLAPGQNGTLWSGALDLAELARREGTPLHVARADVLMQNARAALDASPTVDVFYSYKTNPVPAVLRRLHREGVGAEVISPFELWLAFQLGVSADRVIYNGPAKSPDSVREAIRRGVLLINANSGSEAAMISRIAAEEGRRVNLGIRVALPGMWGGQFGIASEAPELIDVVSRCLSDPAVDLRGLHFHRGLTIRDAATMATYVGSVLEFCDSLRVRTGWHPAVLDLGGSFACPTVASIPKRQFRLNRALGTDLLPPDPATCLGLADAAVMAERAVTSHYRVHDLPPPRVILEPGRAMTGNTQLLLTSVVDVKDDGPLLHAVLDAGINVAEPVPNEYHQLFSVSAPNAPATHSYRLVGPICTPADVLYNNWRLPRLDVGHVLAIMDTGAYFVPFSTSFSFPRPPVVIHEGADIVPARRRETFDDIVALDDDPRATTTR